MKNIESEQVLKSKMFPFFAPIFIMACIIKIFQGGYETGQWLYQALH
jgi:hypothetical protein